MGPREGALVQNGGSRLPREAEPEDRNPCRRFPHLCRGRACKPRSGRSVGLYGRTVPPPFGFPPYPPNTPSTRTEAIPSPLAPLIQPHPAPPPQSPRPKRERPPGG